MKTIVFGAGGHSAVVIECLRAGGSADVVGILDVDPAAAPVLGVPVLGTDARMDEMLAQGVTHAVIAIGENALRQRIGERASAAGFVLAPVIHPSAIVSDSCLIGQGTVIMAGAIIQARSRVGAFAIINTGARIDHDAHIGDAVHVAPSATLAGCVRVGARALVGAGSVAVPNVSIGADVMIGAGAAVIRDVPAGQKVGGVPAAHLRSRN